MWAVVREHLIDLLVLLVSMPVLETVLPAPGTPAAAQSAATSNVDERVLRKVRALLAKAESTEFEDEADALTAKAQQLMTVHSIEPAVAEGPHQSRSHPVVRRIWLDAPYLIAKSMIIAAVARSNNCYSISARRPPPRRRDQHLPVRAPAATRPIRPARRRRRLAKEATGSDPVAVRVPGARAACGDQLSIITRAGPAAVRSCKVVDLHYPQTLATASETVGDNR